MAFALSASVTTTVANPARAASLVETCKLNGSDPLAYLTATLTSQQLIASS
jgi:hypothetical protein